MVSTLDSESSDPSSSLGGTCFLFLINYLILRFSSIEKEGRKCFIEGRIQHNYLPLYGVGHSPCCTMNKRSYHVAKSRSLY